VSEVEPNFSMLAWYTVASILCYVTWGATRTALRGDYHRGTD